MRKSIPAILVAILMAVAAFCSSCSAGAAAPPPADFSANGDQPSTNPPSAEPPVLDETCVENAVVARVDLEGGFWGLVTVPDGRKLDPMDPMPPDFRKDRLAVKIWYIPRNDLSGVRMWGRAIDLRRIERRE